MPQWIFRQRYLLIGVNIRLISQCTCCQIEKRNVLLILTKRIYTYVYAYEQVKLCSSSIIILILKNVLIANIMQSASSFH